MTINVVPKKLKDLVEWAREAGVRRLLLTSYGTVEPVREGDAIVLAGMTTVAVTAFDPKSRTIVRWEETGRSKGMMTIVAGVGRGSLHAGEPATRLRDDVFQLLRDEGFEVDAGEWTVASAERSLSSRQKLIG